MTPSFRPRSAARRRPLAAWALAAAASLLSGCPGELEDTVEFRVARESRCPTDFDVEADLFEPTCGTLGCHTGGTEFAASGLDLTTEGVGERLLAHTSAECDGRAMIDPDALLDSYFLEKLGPAPACGDPMPNGQAGLSGLERTCLIEYLADLTGVEPPTRDGGVAAPGDAGEGVDAGGSGPPREPVTFEAEAMALEGYVVDEFETGYIRLPDGTSSGTATATFEGAPGAYELRVRVLEEPDGAPRLTVRVAGVEVASETYQTTAMDNAPRTLGPYSVTLATSDAIVVEGASDGDAWARVDRVELSP